MKTATIISSNLSKKQITYVAIGVIAVLAVVGVSLGFFMFQRVTRASEEAPQNVTISPNASKATVSWQTGSDTIAVIEFGTEPNAGSFNQFAFSESPTTNHTVDISSLKPDTTYYFHIRIGETVYDNGGQLWSFKTPAVPAEEATPTPEASPTEPVETPSVVPTPTPEASPSGDVTPTSAASSSADTTDSTSSASVTPTGSSSGCNFSDCNTIQQNLGGSCNTQDYIKCLFGITGTVSPTSATSPTAAPVSASTKNSCKIDYFQSNTCKSFTWKDITEKDPVCEDTYTKYFVQCKSNSFNSNDTATWYCNETTTSNEITIPCGAAPTPPAGQSVFCRVRAETETGGSTDATQWIYAQTSCSSLSSSISACAISYHQANTCRSFIWDLVNNKNPTCSAAFSKYFLQCKSTSDFTVSTGTWYCNTTSTNHYVDLPCYNAITPADGSSIYCRVRAEDATGGDDHATSWVTTNATCPTSTPTPTYTPTPTFTNTPTPTRTPTP